MTFKSLMKSAKQQWEALYRMTEAAREVLPEGECEELQKVTRTGATRALTRLNDGSAPGLAQDAKPADEITEVYEIKQVLRTAAEG